MKFIDLTEDTGAVASKGAPKKYYPSMHLPISKLEGDYDVGDELTLIVKARIASVSKRLGEKTHYGVELLEMAKKEKDVS